MSELQDIDKKIQGAEENIKLIIAECKSIPEIGTNSSACSNELKKLKFEMSRNQALTTYRQTRDILDEYNRVYNQQLSLTEIEHAIAFLKDQFKFNSELKKTLEALQQLKQNPVDIQAISNQVDSVCKMVNQLSATHASAKKHLKMTRYQVIKDSLNQIPIAEQTHPEIMAIFNGLESKLNQSSTSVEDLQHLKELDESTKLAADILGKIKRLEGTASQFSESVKKATDTFLRRSFQSSTSQERESIQTRLDQINKIVGDIANPEFKSILANLNVNQLRPYEQQCIADLRKRRIDNFQESVRNYVIAHYRRVDRSKISYNGLTNSIVIANHGSIQISRKPPRGSNIIASMLDWMMLIALGGALVLSGLFVLASFALPFVLIGTWGIMTAGIMVLHPIFLMYYFMVCTLIGVACGSLTLAVEMIIGIPVFVVVAFTALLSSELVYFLGDILFPSNRANAKKDWDQLKTTVSELEALKNLNIDSVSSHVKNDEIAYPILEIAEQMKAVVDQANQCHQSVLRAAKTPAKSNGHAFFQPVGEKEDEPFSCEKENHQGASEASSSVSCGSTSS